MNSKTRFTIRLLTAAIITSLPLSAVAQKKEQKERTIALWGHVYDSFTHMGLPAKITLMRQDSTVVDTTTAMEYDDAPYRFDIPAKNEKYIIRAVYDGYDTCYVNYNVRHIVRNSYFDAPWHYMKRHKNTSLSGEHILDGVVVTGTKIQMVQHGDTLVFDASAFNLPEGSMLDALVRQLPGAELKSNGDIYINGRKIDYLTLNGTDFFKGKNKVMLENLPYYTVKNIKVYDKSTKLSEFIGHDVEKKDYVMDVNLKKEYNRGLLGNMEGGKGTDDRYLARLFGLLFTEKTKMGVYGNMNNVNETRSPGSDGDWSPSNSYQGLTTTKQVGLNLSHTNGGKLEETLDGTVTWDDTDNETRTHSENYVAGTDVISDNNIKNRDKSFRVSLDNNFMYRELVNHPFEVLMETKLDINNSKNYSAQTDSTMQDILTNRSRYGSYEHNHNLSFSHYTAFTKKLPWGDNFQLGAMVHYSQTKPNDNFSTQYVEYLREDSTGYRDYYADTRQKEYGYNFEANYAIEFLNGWNLRAIARYYQQWNDIHNDNYLFNISAQDDAVGRQFGSYSLPANLYDFFDAGNSADHSNMLRDYTYGAYLYYVKEEGRKYRSLSFSIMNINSHERMHYTGNSLDTIAHRNYYQFVPGMSFDYSTGRIRFSGEYHMDTQIPEFATLMPYDDSKNPLARRINNPHLKKQYTHEPFLNFSINDSLGNRWFMGLAANFTHNRWGTRTIYNRQTGAYTYMQDNVNGSWGELLRIGCTRYLDRKKKFTLSAWVYEGYNRSVDYAIAYDESGDNLSKVNNVQLEASADLSYRTGKLTAGIDAMALWRHSTSNQPDFTTINAWDYRYGATLNYTLPWDISLATDIRMYSRRGYSVSEMNTNDLVWNALLSRSFIKGRLTAKLQAFDILHKLSNTEYRITPQGHTETWHKSIPRYVMLSLAWKFSRNPKNVRQSTNLY